MVAPRGLIFVKSIANRRGQSRPRSWCHPAKIRQSLFVLRPRPDHGSFETMVPVLLWEKQQRTASVGKATKNVDMRMYPHTDRITCPFRLLQPHAYLYANVRFAWQCPFRNLVLSIKYKSGKFDEALRIFRTLSEASNAETRHDATTRA
jgi:hypothetical protein